MGLLSVIKKSITEVRVKEEDKFYPVAIDQEFQDGRYVVQSELGRGRYASVWLIKDTKTNDPLALKILNSDFYNDNYELFELEVMQRVSKVSATSTHPGRNHVTQLLDHFELQGPTGKHVCLVMLLLGDSIAEKATTGHILRIPPASVKRIAKQMILALDFLHNECGVIHTDIQPSNILQDLEGTYPADLNTWQRKQLSLSLLNDPTMHFRLNDLGIACFVDRHLTDQIQSDYLRAPEVTLEAPWDQSVDYFSLGCLLFQFITGDLPFVGRPQRGITADADRLATLVSLFGPVPDIVLENAARGKELQQQALEGQGVELSLEKVIGQSLASQNVLDAVPQEEIITFCEFLRQMLVTDPRLRKSGSALLQHEWLAGI